MNSLNNKICISIFLFFVFFTFGEKVDAATLFIQPSQTEITVGNIVNIQVFVNTAGKVINNAESIVQFPKDLLEVVSLDKQVSIFPLWVEEPTFSNITGQVTFNGGVPNPGFQGSSGKIISITFRAKKVGVASIILSNAAVRENDGLGTNILSNTIRSEITINDVPVLPPVPPTVIPDKAFVLTSPSHPNQNAWYNNNNVEMSWTLPKNATAVKTLLSAYSNSKPIVYYDSPITKKSIQDIEDGIWYFHVNYLADGIWSEAQYYRLRIDTADPTNLTVKSEKDDTGKVTLYLKANDSLSGIDRFTIATDSDKPITVTSDANGEASVDIQFSRAGEHKLTIIAFDKAGNKTETKTTIVTDRVPELRIDSYPTTIKVNESIEISGTAPYPYVSLRVSLKNNNSNIVQLYTLKSDGYSKFNFISQSISTEGTYTLWVDMLNDDGEVSQTSQAVVISVKTPLILQIGSYTIGLMKVLIPALILIILFLLIALYGWLKFFALYRRVKKESREAERVSDKEFKALRESINRHVTQLKKVKRKLTDKETEFLEEFEDKLEKAEGAITKEMHDVTEL